MSDLKVKTALVTGASRGIGKGIANVLAREGYDLAITYSSEKEKAEEVAHNIEKSMGVGALCIRLPCKISMCLRRL